MSLKSLLKQCLVPLIACAGVVGAGFTGLALHNPNSVVGDSFGRVLSYDSNIVHASWQARPDPWLKSNIVPTLNTAPASVQNLLVVGDEIMLTEPDQAENSFRILDVELLNDTVTRIDTSVGPTQHILITARDSGDSKGRVIRFVLDIDLPLTSASEPQQDQTL